MLAFLGCSAAPGIGQTGPDAEFKAASLLRLQGLFDSSIVRFQSAAALFRVQKQDKGYVQSQNGIADNLIRKSRFSEAESLLVGLVRQSFDLAQKDSLAFQETFYLLAYVANYDDRYDDALALVNRSLQLQSRLSSPSDQVAANCHFLRGLIFKRKGDYPSALASLTRAYEIQTASKQTRVVDRALTIMNIGAVEDATGKYAEAMERYADAMRLLRMNQEGESQFAANCYHYMSGSSRSLGEFDAAVEYEERVLSICERLYGHQHLAVSAALAQLGDIYALSGDFTPAREHYEEALAVMCLLLPPGHTSIAEIERKLARLALETNQLDSANALITRAAFSKSKTLGPNHPTMSDVFEDLGDIARARKECDAATEYYQRAASIKWSIKPSPPLLDLAAIYRKVGEVMLDQGRMEDASEALGRAKSLQDSSRSRIPYLASAIFRTLGDIQRKRGLVEAALASYRRSLDELSTDAQEVTASRRAGIFASCGDLLKEWSGKAGGRLDDLTSAVTYFDSAATLLLQVRKGYQSSESKLFLQEKVLPVFSSGIRLCAELYGRTGDARFISAGFRFAELSKASVLTELVQETKAKISGGVPDSLLERERRLSTIIAFTETKLLRCSNAADSTTIAALQHRLFTARREWNALKETLLVAFPAYKKLHMQDNVAPLDSVRDVLPPQSVLMSYAIADESLYLFVVRHEGSDLYCLGPARSIDQAARRLRTAIKTVDPAAYLRHARFLHSSLIEPAKKNLGNCTRLVIVPDGILHYVPFSALLDNKGTRGSASVTVDFTRLPYLVRSYEVTYSLSGTLYREVASGGLRPADLHPAFAGYAPVFSDSSAPPAIAVNLRSHERSVTLGGKTFDQLEFSEQEVRAITRSFDDAGVPAAGFLRQNATKGRFLATAPGYSIVHIASHGVVNEESPALSAILFSPPRNRAASEEDMLFAGETYSLRLNASLLVLGVCESGLGKYVNGEGVMAITRGFACAGARNIAYSLWKVYDRPANTLMQTFYAHVLKGERYPTALRSAYLEMIADKSTAFPLAWAGFVLAGE